VMAPAPVVLRLEMLPPAVTFSEAEALTASPLTFCGVVLVLAVIDNAVPLTVPAPEPTMLAVPLAAVSDSVTDVPATTEASVMVPVLWIICNFPLTACAVMVPAPVVVMPVMLLPAVAESDVESFTVTFVMLCPALNACSVTAVPLTVPPVMLPEVVRLTVVPAVTLASAMHPLVCSI